MANGNIVHAINLYYFDQELRQFLLNQIIDLEIYMKKELLKSIYQEDVNFRWDNPKYYTSHFLYKKNGQSQFTIMVNEVQSRMKKMNGSCEQKFENEDMLYTNSYGIFLKIYKNLLNEYRNAFINKFYISSKPVKMCSENLQHYLEGILRLRNRCAHGNPVLSVKMMNQVKFLTFDCFDEKCKSFSKLERLMYFWYLNSDNKVKFKEDLMELFDRYRFVLPYCVEKRYLDKIYMRESIDIFKKALYSFFIWSIIILEARFIDSLRDLLCPRFFYHKTC